MNTVRLIVDGAAMEELLAGPAGIVHPWMDRQSWLYVKECQRRAPVRTGCLQGSIKRRWIKETPTGVEVRVVSDTSPCSERHTSYSLFVHEGTAPHDIPNAFGYGQSFGIGGRFDGKFHPGNAANPFMRDALPAFAR